MMKKAIGTFGVALLLLVSPLARARAYLDETITPPARSDQVLRSRPLDLFIPPSSPVEEFVAKWRAQETRRLRALRDQYPTPYFWTGHYDPQQLRDWQRSVLRQQGDAVAGAAGDMALERCLQMPFCQSPVARAVATIASALLRGVHVGTPIGPFQAHLDTPPGVKAEIRRVRVSVEYHLVF